MNYLEYLNAELPQTRISKCKRSVRLLSLRRRVSIKITNHKNRFRNQLIYEKAKI